MNVATDSLMSPATQQCPYPFFERLRADHPVMYMQELNAYFVATYEIGKKILSDAKRFHAGPPNSDGRIYTVPNPAATKILMESGFGTLLNAFTSNDGAIHDAYRDIVEAAFRVSSVRKLETHISQTSSELIEQFAARGQCEAVAEYCVPLPIFIIADMLGVPKAEYRAFKRWSDGITSYQAMIVSEAEAIAGAHDIVEMFHYMSRQLRERRESPREDLLTLIAHASYHGERSLTESEALSMIQQILVAGNETTSNSLSESLLWLAKDQELQGALRRSPEHVPIFVEEMLRLSAPLQGAMRFTIEDVLLGGVAIPAGSAVFISLASANRDECKFEGAELPNVQRRNAGAHLTFGSGSHHCLGAELARLEMRQGLRSWLTRFSTIEIERGAERIEYPRSFALRGPVALKLRMH